MSFTPNLCCDETEPRRIHSPDTKEEWGTLLTVFNTHTHTHTQLREVMDVLIWLYESFHNIYCILNHYIVLLKK